MEVPERRLTPPGGSSTLVVGRLSRLIKEKGPYSFVLAAPLVRAALQTAYSTVRFVLGGDGRVVRFEAPVEPKLAPLPFVRL